MWNKLFGIKKCDKRRNVEQWELDLLINTLRELPTEYHFLIDQVKAGLLKRVLTGLGDLPRWKTFSYDSEIINEYEKLEEGAYLLTNIFIFDTISKKYLEYTIGYASGTLAGYSINSDSEFYIDVSKIDVQHFRKRFLVSDEYHQLKKMFTLSEQKLINLSDVYEVELEQKKYYHLMDVKDGDGDFIGIDDDKNAYLITHDPFEIKLLNLPFEQVLSGDINLK